jgi:hypothetical protein
MKRLIEEVDKLLSLLEVRGDSVMLLADARKILGEVYRMAPEEPEKKPEEGSEKK